MSLTAGDRLGPYEIVSKLGEGGMGEVYRARDPKLGRDVALKILPASFASNPDRLMRFEREAKALASLNHPNIAGIYGVEGHALVMELVEGEDLAERIARGPIAVDDVVPIARQIAAALEVAHEAGIVHRDLKPANVKVRPDGTVKVLDFGLAKVLSPEHGAPSAAPGAPSTEHSALTVTSPAMTGMGMILGTAAYMAPEQAKGRQVDRRADIWAFGVVLYEMLTGARLFDAETVSEVLAAVLRAEVDFTALPAATPPVVRQLLERCLDRDPLTRLRDIGEARVMLERPAPRTDEAAPAAPPRSAWRLAAAVTAVASMATFGATSLLRPSPEPVAPPGLTFPLGVEDARSLMVSPDGRLVAYHLPADGHIWVRPLDRLEGRAVASVDDLASIGAGGLFWAPDSETLGYASDGFLWRVAVAGGEPTQICRLENAAMTGATWGADNRIVFGSWRGGLYEVSASGTSEPTLLLDTPDDVEDFHRPSFLPNGALMYGPHLISSDDQVLDILHNGRTTRLADQPAGYYSKGFLVHRGAAPDTVWAAPFDLDRMEKTGEALPLLSGVDEFSVSMTGVLAYTEGTGPFTPMSRFAWVGADGQAVALIGDARRHGQFRLSPDGTRIAAVVIDRGERSLIVIDAARGASVPLVAPAAVERDHPAWSADGRFVFFHEARGFLDYVRVVPVDGSRPPEDVVQGASPTLSSDGRRLIFTRDERGRRSLWHVALDGSRPSGQPALLRESTDSLETPQVSPDGLLVAFAQGPPYRSFNGATEIVLSRAADGSGQWPVSVGGGRRPTWLASTSEILFTQADRILAVPVTPGTEPGFGSLRTVMMLDSEALGGRAFGRHLSMTPDGRRVLKLEPVDSDRSTSRVIVVQNWPEVLLNGGR